jgi:Rrf2 family protein
MISKTAEYALRAMLALARHPGGRMVTKDVSTAAHLPPHYLSKVIQPLIRAGLVDAQKGKGGGICLKVDAAEISVLAILDAVEPIEPYAGCPLSALNVACRTSGLCALHSCINDVVLYMRERFSRTTLAELASAGEEEAGCRNA